MSATELRALPRKDEWTDDEALSLYEDQDGMEVVQGIPTPPSVQTRADRVRWANAVRVAVRVTGEPATGQLATAAAMEMFNDREHYA